jgi:serine protease Do
MTVNLTDHDGMCRESTRRPQKSGLGRNTSFGLKGLAFRGACLLFGLSLVLALAPKARAEADIRRDAAVQAVEGIMPSVVNIATEQIIEYHDAYDQMLRQFFGWSRAPQRFLSLGSGVIINEDGYILTNDHVVRQASRIQVKLWDGREYEAEGLVGTRHSDVALLKIKGKPGEKFKAAKFAPDDDLLLGETVLALGNPYGLGGSVSKGILSSKTRRPPSENEPLNVENWLQTDAAINPGNSGGPLINLRGELIGLNVAVYSQGHGIGFAIPIKEVNDALASFFIPETTDSLWLGLRLKCGGSALAISQVQPGSPAEAAGLQPGDQLLRINGQAVSGLIPFHRLVKDSSNHEVALVVKRGSEQHSFKVRMVPFPDLVRQKLGCTVLELTEERAARLGVKPGEGLLIDAVDKDGPADRARLQRGYLVTGIDGQGANDLHNLADVLAGKKKGEVATLTVVVRRPVGTNFVELRQGTVEVPVR